MISLEEPSCNRQCHWLLPCGGYPQSIAALVGAPLCITGRPARTWLEWLDVLAPLSPLAGMEPPVGQPAPHYRYLLQLPATDRGTIRVSCWRRYPEGVRWQRRCGPMPLNAFVERFSGSQESEPMQPQPGGYRQPRRDPFPRPGWPRAWAGRSRNGSSY